MMTRFLALFPGLALAVATLSACTDTAAPNAYAAMSQGVGFGDYQRHLRAQDAARRPAVPYTVPPELASGAAPTPAAAAAVAGAPLPAPAAPVAAAQPVVPLAAATVLPDPATPRPAGVADSATFQPVAFGQRPAGAEIPPVGVTGVVPVAAVPAVPAPSGPNVLAYALRTTHAVGTTLHRRNNPLRWSRWERACLQFGNQDLAQEAFLAAGGPERDPNHLDPDGDGFACWWDPTPMRRLAAIAPTQEGAAD